jgi:hypothetical protein
MSYVNVFVFFFLLANYCFVFVLFCNFFRYYYFVFGIFFSTWVCSVFNYYYFSRICRKDPNRLIAGCSNEAYTMFYRM